MLLTGLIAVAPELRFAYPSASARVAIETAAAVVASVAAYLLVGRYRRDRGTERLLAAIGMTTLASGNLLEVLAVVASGPPGLGFLGGGASVAGIGAMAAAGIVHGRAPSHRPVATLIAVTGTVAIVAGGLFDLLGSPVVDTANVDPSRPLVGGHVGAMTFNAVAILGLVVAAGGFARRADSGRDDALLGWLSLGLVVAAGGRLQSLLFPPSNPDWVYSSTVLRLAFHGLLLVGAALEIERYWRGLASVAVLDERRRLARDLHDGVAQELAHITRIGHRLAAGGDRDAHDVVAAAARGMASSRRAISALTRPLDEPFEVALGHAVQDVGTRLGATIDIDLDGAARAGPAVHEALIRIACEAVTNAVVHGEASRIRVALDSRDGLRMEVVDDGLGFHEGSPAAVGFGLVSMRERATEVGGTCTVRSEPGAGTSVVVVVP